MSKVYIIYAGSETEREDLEEVSQQVSECLTIQNQPNEIIPAYAIPPHNWGRLRHNAGKALLLDPYYRGTDREFDLRDSLETLGVPYSGPRKFSSYMTANKMLTKKMLTGSGILTIPDTLCSSVADLWTFMRRKHKDGYIIKPTNGGGGQDVVFVREEAEAEASASKLIKTYGSFMVEPYLKGVEISVPIIRQNDGVAVTVLPPVSITLQNGFAIFDEEAKRTSHSVEMEVPANVSPKEQTALEAFSRAAYEMLRFNGLLRVDFLQTEKGLYFLEANSYPSLGRNYGISVPSAKSIGYEQSHVVNWLLHTAKLGG